MSLDYTGMQESIACWGYDRNKISANFFSCNEDMLATLRLKMFDVATQMWLRFKEYNMFDVQNNIKLSFPFVLTGIVGTNLMFLKDNVLSSNEVTNYG